MVRMIGAAIVCAGALAAASAEEMEIKYRPLSIAGLAEFGMLNGARYGSNDPLETDWVDHFGAFVTQTADVGDHLSFDVGLGGIFQFMKRELVLATWLGTQWKAFFIGPTVADLRYGSLRDGDGFGLQFGRFTYKYNPEATNLGEYMFRSGPYPTFLLGGGYAVIGAPQAYLQGLRLNYTLGGFRTDLFVVGETTIPTLYDFSVAALASYSMGEGLLDVGAGVNFKRILPVRPSKTTPKVSQNSYFTRNNKVYTGYTNYYTEQANFYTAMAKRFPADSAAHMANAATFAAIADSVGNDNRAFDDNGAPKTVGWLDSATQLVPGSEFYTQKAITAMVRASLDIKKLVGSGPFGPNDLKLSVEANVLGIKDYPIFYENVADRIPITATFNLPGFKYVDLISLQVERFASPWMNGYGNLLGNNGYNVPVPTLPTGGDENWNETAFNDISERDNLSWSLLIRKNMVGAAWAAVQFARDHSRTVSKDFWVGGGLEPTEVLGREQDWYMMVQLGFGI